MHGKEEETGDETIQNWVDGIEYPYNSQHHGVRVHYTTNSLGQSLKGHKIEQEEVNCLCHTEQMMMSFHHAACVHYLTSKFIALHHVILQRSCMGAKVKIVTCAHSGGFFFRSLMSAALYMYYSVIVSYYTLYYQQTPLYSRARTYISRKKTTFTVKLYIPLVVRMVKHVILYPNRYTELGRCGETRGEATNVT